MLQNLYENVAVIVHQANHEVIFAWLDARNYEGTEQLRILNVLIEMEKE